MKNVEMSILQHAYGHGDLRIQAVAELRNNYATEDPAQVEYLCTGRK